MITLYVLHCREYKSDEVWFLKKSEEVPESGLDAMSTLSSSQTSAQKEEVAIINISNLVVKFESGSGNNTIPLLLMESNFNCNVKDFWNNKRMTIIGNFNVEMAYYNAKLALWEHVIEKRGVGYRYVIRTNAQCMIYFKGKSKLYTLWTVNDVTGKTPLERVKTPKTQLL